MQPAVHPAAWWGQTMSGGLGQGQLGALGMAVRVARGICLVNHSFLPCELEVRRLRSFCCMNLSVQGRAAVQVISRFSSKELQPHWCSPRSDLPALTRCGRRGWSPPRAASALVLPVAG